MVPRIAVCLAALCLGAALLPLPAGAQPPAGPAPLAGAGSDGVEARELARIRAALERVAAALERQRDDQRLDLAVKQVDLRMRRLSSLEQQVRGLRSDRQARDGELAQVEIRARRLTQRATVAETRSDAEEAEAAVGELVAYGKRLKAQIAELDSQLQLLESEAAERKAEIDQMLQWLDRRLGGG